MPLRNDQTAWWNLPGCLVAYQSVAAPGPNLARYNMRAGGTNAYRAEPGVLPTWSAMTGWTFNGSSQYLQTNVIPGSTYSWVMRFTGASTTGTNLYMHGVHSPTANTVRFGMGRTTLKYWGHGDFLLTGALIASGTQAITPGAAWLNGNYVGAISTWSGTATRSILLGAMQIDAAINYYWPGNVVATAIYERPLTSAEVWSVSRQMAYCDVNPDWSVWGRRRRWYYGAGVAGGFQAAWARNANSVHKVIGQ